MRIRYILLVLMFVLLLPACSNVSQPAVQDTASHVAKVKVTRDSHLYLNGTETTLDDLKQEFARLATVQGEVWYYRESPESEPPAIVGEVIQAVIDAQLPIKLSETDFA